MSGPAGMVQCGLNVMMGWVMALVCWKEAKLLPPKSYDPHYWLLDVRFETLPPAPARYADEVGREESLRQP